MFNSIYSTLEKIQFNGAVYVEKSNNEIVDVTIGAADMKNLVPITGDTLFNIASLSKMYTAVMVLQLIEKKVIHFNDNLTKWFDTSTFQDVTIEELLTHTSGIPEYIDNSSVENIEDILLNKEPYFLPGSSWLYTNTNYVLLAKIIEQASQLSYEDYLQRMIAQPLQLINTTTKPKSKPTAVSKLFDFINKKYIHVIEDPIFKDINKKYDFYGDGGIYATAQDIARFVKGFLQGKLVSLEMMNRALTPSPLNSSYGCGFIIQDGSIGHSGGWPGNSSHCLCSLTSEEVTVLLTNEEVSPFYEQQILEFLNQPNDSSEPDAPKQPRIMKFNSADNIVGPYQLADEYQTSFIIKEGIDSYIISFHDQHDTQLFKVEPNLYWIRNTMSYIHISEGIFIDEGVEIAFHKQ
ncbi:beta-lactamase family protein [Paenibacillus sp. ACRRX]|uniref:serine hydrolase domain-containing protein n=1 Tax=Paenibacillus sp. ACRRX TaxID=2918206 RepID=UPI001EF6DFF8|nr:serine hydrolase domain-containing protein [Paenibacillus sp. ACRRX]MCG7409404.1 beta-lactamase family protein [Paenibacillus sp. ACRRX]